MSVKDFEMVIGLEVHCELSTKTKIFCSCPTTYGAPPNTQICPVCMGMPGTLPVLNRKVVEYAIKAGLATNCTVNRHSRQDRKNYFYPDLPKAYQISQYDLPLCEHGWLEIGDGEGKKRIGITRIHIEEDAGKLIHDEKLGTLIDCNRCGVPLIEIVSEPDIRSASEAVDYLKKLRSLILYTGVSDCKMNEGSMRCDVNLSVRKVGDSELGTRTEIKNLNSFSSVERAIESEFLRQVEEIEAGGQIVQETRRFDQESGKTSSMRSKENADDYRYFPDPDLLPILTSEEKLKELSESLPTMPDVRRAQVMEDYQLSAYDAGLITADPDRADYFAKTAKLTRYPKTAANLLIGELSEGVGKLSEEHFAKLCDLLGDGVIGSATAKKLIRELTETDADPALLVDQRGLRQITDRRLLTELAQKAVSENPKAVQDFAKGKSAAVMSIVGKVMSATGGRADPVLTSSIVGEIFRQELEKE